MPPDVEGDGCPSSLGLEGATRPRFAILRDALLHRPTPCRTGLSTRAQTYSSACVTRLFALSMNFSVCAICSVTGGITAWACAFFSAASRALLSTLSSSPRAPIADCNRTILLEAPPTLGLGCGGRGQPPGDELAEVDLDAIALERLLPVVLVDVVRSPCLSPSAGCSNRLWGDVGLGSPDTIQLELRWHSIHGEPSQIVAKNNNKRPKIFREKRLEPNMSSSRDDDSSDQ